MEVLAAQRQSQAAAAEARTRALEDQLKEVRASRDEYKAEWKAAQHQLREEPPTAIPALHRAAPWMLAGAIGLVFVAFFLLLAR